MATAVKAMVGNGSKLSKRAAKLDKLLKERPIFQSPMAGAQDSAMALAVHRAGGLGAIPAAMMTAQQLREQCALFEKEVPRDEDGLLPVNVNFFCHVEAEGNEADRTWLDTLRPYFQELNLDVNEFLKRPVVSRKSFDDESLQVLMDVRPLVVSFHFGLPRNLRLGDIREKLPLTLLVCSATTRSEAGHLDRHGVDAVIVQGFEAGGHRGTFLDNYFLVQKQVGVFALASTVRRDLPEAKLIAAGGINSPATVRSMKALGMNAVQVGTSLLLSKESKVTSVHRSFLKEGVYPTALTNVFTGRPARSIVNRLIEDLGYINTNKVPPFPRATNAITYLRGHAEKEGKADFSALWSGQSGVGPLALQYELQSAEHIIHSLRSAWISADTTSHL